MSLWDRFLKRGRSRVAVDGGGRVSSSSAAHDDATVLRRADDDMASAIVPGRFAPDAQNKIAGTFPVKRVLGSGSMGTVYLVQHPSWNTEVALKVPRAELIADPENRHRITVEAEVWTELGLHPHIAYCYYVQALDGVLVTVVEYLDGGNLAQWIGRNGQSADLKTKLDLAIQFCHGLEHAHGKGLIHRDIKPSNVLLTRDGRLKLTDFGIARVGAGQVGGRAPAIGAPASGTMVGIGTDDYMPPEQWKSAQVDVRADLFAFGVCLYELFCGRRPYSGRLLGARQRALDPVAANPTLPRDIGDLMKQCVAWDQSERPSAASDIRKRLSALYKDQFQQASPYNELPRYTINAATLNNKALSYIELGRTDLAEQAWQAALTTNPGIEVIYNHGLHEWRASRLADDALLHRLETARGHQDPAWLPAYLVAQVHLERGDGESALLALATIAGDGLAPEVLECKRAAELLCTDSFPMRGSWRTSQLGPSGELIRARRNDLCFCGSGKRYKLCHGGLS